MRLKYSEKSKKNYGYCEKKAKKLGIELLKNLFFFFVLDFSFTVICFLIKIHSLCWWSPLCCISC